MATRFATFLALALRPARLAVFLAFVLALARLAAFLGADLALVRALPRFDAVFLCANAFRFRLAIIVSHPSQTFSVTRAPVRRR
jgi:hypothetical protein